MDAIFWELGLTSFLEILLGGERGGGRRAESVVWSCEAALEQLWSSFGAALEQLWSSKSAVPSTKDDLGAQ